MAKRSIDPSRTFLLRRSFYADMKRRCKALETAVWKLFVKDDILSWKDKNRKPLKTNAVQNIDPNAFQFATNPAKITMFRRWLKAQVDAGLLEAKGGIKGKPWTATYIESAYRKGVLRAYTDVHKKELSKGAAWFGGAKEQFLRMAFAQPVLTSQLELLVTRSYNLLNGVSNAMSDKMAFILAEGLAHGRSPTVIAREMRKAIAGLTRTRALAIARTEIINAHAEGQLDSFQLMGISEVEAEVEFSTAGDDLVCEECSSLEGKIYTIEEARGVIPVHPNCVVGSSIIESPDPIALMRSRYTGPIVEMRTSKGRFISVTENHILLTDRGWVLAKELTNSHNLIETSSFNRKIGLVCPDENKSPASIEETFEFFADTNNIRVGRIDIRSNCGTYFHGDGKSLDGKIEIIGFEGILRNDFESEVFGKFEEFLFMLRRRLFPYSQSLSCLRSLASLLKRTATTTDSLMGGLSHPTVFLRRSVGCEDLVGFSLGANPYPLLIESSPNNCSADIELFTDSDLCPVPVIQTKNFFDNILRENNFGFGVISGNTFESVDVVRGDERSLQPGNFQSMGNPGLRHAQNSGDFRGSLPTFVEFDRIVDVRFVHHSGLLVYDISTESSVYSINGILSSNCRCSWNSVVDQKLLKK